MNHKIKRLLGVICLICALGWLCFLVIYITTTYIVFEEIILYLSSICISMATLAYVFLTEFGISKRKIKKITGVISFVGGLLLICFVFLIANKEEPDIKGVFILVAMSVTGLTTIVYVILTRFGNTKLNENDILKRQGRMKELKKLLFIILILWSFMHTFLLLMSFPFRYIELESLAYSSNWVMVKVAPSEKFYPFTYMHLTVDKTKNPLGEEVNNYDLRFYDSSEYFIYVGGIWLIYFLYRYLKGSKYNMITKKDNCTTNI